MKERAAEKFRFHHEIIQRITCRMIKMNKILKYHCSVDIMKMECNRFCVRIIYYKNLFRDRTDSRNIFSLSLEKYWDILYPTYRIFPSISQSVYKPSIRLFNEKSPEVGNPYISLC